MKAEDIKQFYNNNFFDDGNVPASVPVQITISIEKESIILPKISIQPTVSINSIFHFCHSLLKDQKEEIINSVEEANEADKALEEVKPLNIDTINYRNNLYVVDHYPDDNFVVRKNDGQIIPANSPIYNTVLKKYREKIEPK